MVHLVVHLVPEPGTAIRVGTLGAAITLPATLLTDHLHRRRGWPVPYTRKVFHYLIFSGAGTLDLLFGRGGVSVYGSTVTLLVLWAILRGPGFGLFDALARPSDAPREAAFVVIPLMMTIAGGLLSLLFFPATAAVGYLACGWGDALGEPVGRAWGDHAYRVPSLFGVPARRTLEGSTAVLLGATLASTLALRGTGLSSSALLAVAAGCGVVTTVVEALSHHGLDNLTIQVAASGTAWFLLAS